MAGRWSRDDAGLVFTPRFPFVRGAAYHVFRDGKPIGALRVPPVMAPPDARVEAISPGCAEVPCNLLRVYVHFSSPMEEGWSRRALIVRRTSTGEPIEDVFLDMAPELWDPTRRRLTALLDPGRIKRGLVPHLERGYPLVEGEEFEVAVLPAWRDARGRPLGQPFARRYRVGAAVRCHVDPRRWSVTVPAAGTRLPFRVTFERALDAALAASCLELRAPVAGAHVGRGAGEGSPGDIVRGVAQVDPDGCGWSFTPDTAWPTGSLALRVDGRLEDLAGNSVVRVFDRDLTRPEDAPREAACLVAMLAVGEQARRPDAVTFKPCPKE